MALGEKDRAFELLGEAVDRKEVYLFLKVAPLYDPLRSDARFAQLLRRMRLD